MLGELKTEFTSPIENPLTPGYRTLLSLHADHETCSFTEHTLNQLHKTSLASLKHSITLSVTTKFV